MLRGRESNSGDTAYETGRETFLPAIYGVIEENRTLIGGTTNPSLTIRLQPPSQVLDSNQRTTDFVDQLLTARTT